MTLEPHVDFNAYITTAVIDWVDLVFRTVLPTQRRWIFAELEKAIGSRSFVWQNRDEDEVEYREFRVRFQEPEMKDLLAAELAIKGRWELTQPTMVENLEISVDFRPKVPSDVSLARIFGVLVRSHIPGRDVISELSDRPRFTWGKGKGKTAHILAAQKGKPHRNDELLLATDKDRPAVADASYYVGAKKASPSWRTMTKIMDQQNKATGKRLILPENERRVRIEVTLSNTELRSIGIDTMASLMAFRFQTFQGLYFRFRLPTFVDVSVLPKDNHAAVSHLRESQRRTKFLNSGVVGLKAMDDARARQTGKLQESVDKNGTGSARRATTQQEPMVAYKALTDRVLMALRHLGGRVHAATIS
ncbi:hypothetical protein LHFGNBLO_002535 [Mesorhizobium sp. AR10]|uniref:hypothetical protein n=1 Tax=Mesorhizobium sp. AR10 TaxID=2865839 RepID=UPI0021602BAD|nr:hypothetical protein [Mesorhizobium sp. AR10]UVK40995.1 hypothetical protein LHFGNBLO_002535 [Mesorhizobium sp. AR10]